MRLLLTVERFGPPSSADVVVDYSPGSTVGDLARELESGGARNGTPPGSVPPLDNVISLHGRNGSSHGGVDLYLGAERLDPGATIDASPVTHGVVLGVGAPSSHRGTEPQGVAEVRISSGPNAGHVHRLSIGKATIGPGQHCTIRVPCPAGQPSLEGIDVFVRLDVAADGILTLAPDPALAGLTMPVPIRREPLTAPIVLEASSVAEESTRRSRRKRKRKKKAAELVIGERVDPMAPIPLVHLDRRAVAEPTTWDRGACLGVGAVLLEHMEVPAPDASLSPSPSSPELDYNRPPRLHPAARPTEFAIPTEPRRPDKMPFPVAMLFAPLLMGGVAYLVSHRPYTLLMALFSPLMLIMNSTGSRKHQKRRYVEQMDEYQERRVAVEQAAVDSLLSERTRRRTMFPDPASVLLFATGPRARLWERRRWDVDFLHLRLGTADLPSEVTIKDPGRAEHEGPLKWTAPDVPVTVPLAQTGVIGVAGPEEECRTLAMWMVAQVAALHSPSDVTITVLTGSAASTRWDWAKWLPHTRLSTDSTRPVRVSVDEESQAGLISALLADLEQRRQLQEKDRAGLSSRVVVLDGAREIRMTPGLVSLLKEGPAVGLFFVCLDRSVRELPEECRTVAEWTMGELNLEINEQRHVDGIRVDLVEQAWLVTIGHALAPIRDVSTEDLSATLPAASRLFDVLRLGDDPGTEGIVRAWAAGGRTTKAVIGESNDGPFVIDMRADGPHGLVAGTTGSGKSELLQTIIASLAYGNRPDEFNFVLVDYKGGAAFKDCNHLPHTVGMVTDLDGHLTTRALESLGAELRVREHQLAAADAKDIEDYTAGRGPGDAPMPRLLIVIDEFAALVAELPDFVNGLVDVARRGRSLGVHLILATQRPAGVVSAEIKSNTNLRIALRVTDAGDSDDVIESPVAAEIAKSFPGRAYARLGHSSLTPFQSSRVGGRPIGEGGESLLVRGIDWSDLRTFGRVGPSLGDEEDDVSVPTDLATLVHAIQGANDQLGIPQMRRPWLPPLPESLALDGLGSDPGELTAGALPPIPFGLADLPHLQQQRVETWDIVKGSHLMIAGQARSGRSNALRVLAGSIADLTSPEDVHIYGIDAGNNALLPLVALPHVGAVVTRTQTDRLFRLLGMLQKELASRQQSLAREGYADIAEQRAAVPAHERLPYLVVLLDRWEGYLQALESVDNGVLIDQFMALLQEGAGVGLRIVMGSDRSGLIGRIGMLVEDKVALAQPDPGDFAAIGLNSRQVPVSMPPGRAFRSGERPLELQWAMLDASGVGTEQVRALQEIGRRATERSGSVPTERLPKRVDELPPAISMREARELPRATDHREFVAVGVGGDTLSLQGFVPELTGNGFLIAGPPRSGRSTALHFLLSGIRELPVTVFVPRRSPLRDNPPAGVKVFTGDEPFDTIQSHLDRHRHQVIAVDDFEVLGPDSQIGQMLSERYAGMRDSPSLLVASGSVDDLGNVYRGLPAELKRGRTGLLLSPRGTQDGEVINVRLPRSVAGAMPTGRGVLATPVGWTWVQVPSAT